MATPSFLSDSQGERVDTIIDSAGSTYYKGAIGSNAAGGNGPTAAQLIGTHKPSVATAATDPFVAVLGTQWGAVGSNTYPIAVDTAGRVIVTGSSGATAIPISGALTTTPPANASTNITQVGGVAVALGATTGSASVPVVLATDGVTIGALTEAAPATDTASSGLNGRLQRIAQRLTSLIGLLPAALGQGTMAQSLSVVVASNQSAIQGSAAQGTLTDRSGTITSGGTAQTLAAANASRKYLLVQNPHATETLWINFTTTAVTSQPSISIPAGGGAFVMESSFLSTEAVSVIAATTAHPFIAKEG